jgi:hypothetical protein
MHDGIEVLLVEWRGNLDSLWSRDEVVSERMQLCQRRQRANFQGKLGDGIAANEKLFEERKAGNGRGEGG